MRSFLLFFIYIFCANASNAQKKKPVKEKELQVYDFQESILIRNTPYSLGFDSATYLSPKNFNIVLNRLLGQVAVGSNSGADLVNYATFEPLNGSFSLNGYGQVSKREEARSPIFMSLNVKGGLLNSNATELFSNSKLNTNVSGQLKLHIGLPQKALSFMEDDNRALYNKKDTVLKYSFLQLVNVKQKMDDQVNAIQNMDSKLTITGKRLFEKRALLDKVINTLVTMNRDDTDELSKFTDSSITLRKVILQQVLDSFAISQDLKSLKNEKVVMDSIVFAKDKTLLESRYSMEHYVQINRAFKKQIDTLELKAPLIKASFRWLTVTIGGSRQKYHTYTPSKPFAEQIDKQALDALELGLAFNYYRQNFDNGRIIYFNTGFSRLKNNNTALLSTTEVVDEDKSAEGAITRKTVSKYNAFTDPINEFMAWLLYVNGYYMFGRKDKSAIHLFPEYEVRDAKEDVCNMGFGYVFSFKDKKDGKTMINMEAFIKFLDIGNAQGTDSKFYNRNTIGVSVGLPFNFIF